MSDAVEYTQLECLRCHTTMESLGSQTYRTFGFLGDTFLVYRCPSCGKVEFFEFIIEPDEDIDCLNCGGIIKAGQEKCSVCGWTWKDSDD